MVTEQNPNIKELNKIYLKHKVSINVSNKIFLTEKKEYPQVILTLSGKSFKMFVDDEYDDFKYNYPILTFCVVLRELEDYEYCSDYLEWCNVRHIDASDEKIRNYYMGLDKIYNEIEIILGEISSFIPDMDFDFAMGEVRILREENW